MEAVADEDVLAMAEDPNLELWSANDSDILEFRDVKVDPLAGSLAVLHLVLRGGEGIGIVRALVVADDKVSVATAETVVVIGTALRVLGRLLGNAEVQDAVVHVC